MRKLIVSSLIILVVGVFLAGCAGPADEGDITSPVVSSTYPATTATGVFLNGYVSATFSEAMDPSTIGVESFILEGASAVAGDVALNTAGTTAIFTPNANLAGNTVYTATITTGAMDLAGNPMENAYSWSFTTGATATVSRAPVDLATAGNYVLLAKSGVSTTGTTAIDGDIGLSPAATSYLTGFSQTLNSTSNYATTDMVTGRLYAADMAPPTPIQMTTAVSDMELAFTDAAGRSLPDFTELGAGDVSSLTLVPGLYKWGTGLLMATDVTLAGSATDVWIFQIAEDLTVSNGVQITLSGGALSKNIFWQVSGQATLGTTSSFKGIILCQTAIVMRTGAAFEGRALAQTAITLDANAVTKPSL